MFHPWGGGIRQLCERGFLNCVVGEQKAYTLAPEFTPIPEVEAKLELAKRYFTYYGPATIHDAMYFFHVSASQVKKWLSALPVTAIQCAGKTYFYIDNGMVPNREIPKCLFLAGFDQMLLGYEKKESLYLKQEDIRSVFNMAGIVMPTVMLDGIISGKWKKKDNKLQIELFRSLSDADLRQLHEKAEKLWPEIQKIDIK